MCASVCGRVCVYERVGTYKRPRGRRDRVCRGAVGRNRGGGAYEVACEEAVDHTGDGHGIVQKDIAAAHKLIVGQGQRLLDLHQHPQHLCRPRTHRRTHSCQARPPAPQATSNASSAVILCVYKCV
jgi:hypothetical protein